MIDENPNVTKMLDLSTGHLPESVARDLETIAFPFSPIMIRAEGFLFYVPSPEQREEITARARQCGQESAVKILIQCFEHADLLECSYVMFDRDAEAIPGLPFFDW